jgi:hypothetical protein
MYHAGSLLRLLLAVVHYYHWILDFCAPLQAYRIQFLHRLTNQLCSIIARLRKLRKSEFRCKMFVFEAICSANPSDQRRRNPRTMASLLIIPLIRDSAANCYDYALPTRFLMDRFHIRWRRTTSRLHVSTRREWIIERLPRSKEDKM